MIPELGGGGGLGLGALEEKGPKCLKGTKTINANMVLAEKQFKRSKKGPFSLYMYFPRSLPGNGINGARGEGPSAPPPGFSSHA